ncbi:MAG: YggS family pyridoxal phosphate-dependent enzyme [Acidimicrobiia bacterium]|nr:YggS family pyridoxal phosphate-dependent enzyme [Acidimicrobiia bacterium]
MVARALTRVIERMSDAADRCGRDPGSVTLVAVTKGQSVDTILEAYQFGHRDFGENRAAELAEKAPQLPDDIRWHFIGSLQTRQVKLARPETQLLHSLDRIRLINRWADTPNPPPALLQVNIAEEPQKHGATVGDLGELLGRIQETEIDCRGLMCIPPLVQHAEENRHWFAALRALRDELLPDHPGLVELSMGMTDDYEVAIEEGATLIRVGRAIFGAPGQNEDS